MFVQLLVLTMIMYQASVSEAFRPCTGYNPPVTYGCNDCSYDNELWTKAITCG